MSPVCRFAWIVCVTCSVASVAAAPLIEPASGREFRADYGLPVRHVTPGDLGLGPKDVVRVGLSTRFDEALVQLAVQGLVNRSAPLMWIDNAPVDWGHGEETWRGYYAETRGLRFVSPGNDLAALLKRVVPACNGLVLYDQDAKTDQVFVAVNLANLNSCLPVSRRLYREHHDILGKLPVVASIPRDAFTRRAIYEWLIAEVLPRTDRTAAMSHRSFPGAHEHGSYQSLDYAFYRKCLIFDLAASDDITLEGAELCDAIFARLTRLAYVLGWGDNEFEFCKRLSLRGHSWLNTVASPNLSFHAAMKPLQPPPFVQDLRPRVQTPQKKLYLAFAANEGDTGTVMTQLYYRAWNQPGRGKVPLSWAIDPAWIELAPALVEYFVRTKTPNDTFICPPCGAGYFYPQYMPQADLDRHVSRLARLMKTGLDLPVVMLWQGDARPALRSYVTQLPGLQGLTLEHDIADGVRIPAAGGARKVPVLGFGGKQQYWITRDEFVDKQGQVKVAGLVQYLDSLYDPAKLPQFVPFYGFVEGQVNGLAELQTALDPSRYEIVDMNTLAHLASRAGREYAAAEPRPAQLRWRTGLDRDLSAWKELLNNPVVRMTDRGLRVEIPAGTTWAVAAMPDLLLPPQARRLRVRIADLHAGTGGWIIKCYGDFAGVGEMSHWLPVGLQTTARQADVPLTPQVLGAADQPMRQFQVGLIGNPGDYVVFESIDFVP